MNKILFSPSNMKRNNTMTYITFHISDAAQLEDILAFAKRENLILKIITKNETEFNDTWDKHFS